MSYSTTTKASYTDYMIISKQLKVNITNLKMNQLHKWNANDRIPKGRSDNREALNACRAAKEQFLCYYWASGSEVMYVGSVSKDYKSKSKADTNLSKRLANYFGNHKTEQRNNKEVHNTNLRIFNAANAHLSQKPLEFGTFSFESAQYNGTENSYGDCSSDANFVRMLEHMLITYFRDQKQCKWNA